MPWKSEAQRRLFYAAASGKPTKAELSPEVAREFIRHTGKRPPLRLAEQAFGQRKP